MTTGTITDDPGRSKAVLFCPGCRYRGPWTEWRPVEGESALRCPSCGTTVG